MIVVEALKKTFGNRTILDGIDLRIEEGQVVCLIGPSGSGKSTLLRCLNFLEVPDSGRIFFDGLEAKGESTTIQTIRQKMGMVFQHFYLFPQYTVLENICLAPVLLKRKTPKEAEERARILLEQVGLLERASAYPSTLSGGEKQRVAIARSLAMEPKALLFDEPTSALDPEMVGEVLQVIRNLAHHGMTLMIVTHQLAFARQVSDRILFLDEGKICADGSPEELFSGKGPDRLNSFLARMNLDTL